MNGRIYDPKLHRFLQPDNYVQDPSNTLNFNRYGYVLNNPLRYIDLTGETWWDNNWKTVLTITASVATAVIIVASMGTATPIVAAMWAGAGAGFVGGTLGTALNGGSFGQSLGSGFKGALFGALSGYLGGAAALAYAPAGAFSGAIYGGTTSTTVGAIVNTLQGKPTFEGAGLNFALGAIGGGYTGFKAAEAKGLNGFTGTPKSSVIADKAVSSVENGTSYAKAVYANAEPTNTFSDNSAALLKDMPSKGLKNYDELLKEAQKLYPNKAGKIELHHIEPKYLGGAKNGTLIPLDAAYHQVITNEFRFIQPYGQSIPSSLRVQEIMEQVYKKYPLPFGN